MRRQNKQKKMNFADVLSAERPQTMDQVTQRWLFLKTEYKRKEIKDNINETLVCFLILIITIIIMIAIACITVKYTR